MNSVTGFWATWAINHARIAWNIYEKTEPPAVETVVADEATGLFKVNFEGGRVFNVEVSGIGRPHKALEQVERG